MFNNTLKYRTSLVAVLMTLFGQSLYAEEAITMTPIIDAGDIVVTETREERSKMQAPESVDRLGQKELEKVAPAHPSEALNRIAGVHVNNLGGEGHMTAIRQPITTSGVYLFLEDGLPTRPAGFFNHNGLYEINIPQSGGLEVIRGSGSALYGSEAIGGIINSITEASPEGFELKLNPEIGSFGWKRGLLSIGDYSEDAQTGFRFNVNATESDGFQNFAEYNRQSYTLRTDTFFNEALTMKNIISLTNVDQSGVSGLTEADYLNNPKQNYFRGDIGDREVYALRISSEWNYEPDQYNLFTFTPFFRDNSMKLMPSWQLTYQPDTFENSFQSYGFQSKYRRNIPSIDAKVITGLDLDYTPSSFISNDITASPDGNGVYENFTVNQRVYDFTANQLAVAPYVHGEIKPIDKLTLSAGLRYDYFHVDYDDKLTTSESLFNAGLGRPVTRLRPDSQSISYDNLSPKFGLIYSFTPDYNAYFNYRRSFRVPSTSSLFASGATQGSENLEPTIADSFEIGHRGRVAPWLNYDVALYYLQVQDDVVSFFDQSNARQFKNAGETTHKGIEISAHGQVTDEWGYRTAFSYSRHKYEDFEYQCGTFMAPANCNRRGFDVRLAPETLGNLAVNYQPNWAKGLFLEAEWVHVGPYYTNDGNTFQYDGHNLLNLRTEYEVNDKFSIYARALNVTDETYSVYTANQTSNIDVQYRPGQPFAVFGGIRVKIGG